MLAWPGSSQRGGISWICAESQYLGLSWCRDQNKWLLWATLKVDILRVIPGGLALTQLYHQEFEGIGIIWKELTHPRVSEHLRIHNA